MKSFHEINGYPKSVINRTLNDVKQNFNTPPPTVANHLSTSPTVTLEDGEITPPTTHLLILPYKGKTGESIIKDMRRTFNAILPPTTITKICYTSNELSTNFNIKDPTNVNRGKIKNCDAKFIHLGDRVSQNKLNPVDDT